MSEGTLAKLREVCMSLPDATERMSHGAPCWFVGKGKQFVAYADHHHGARLAFWCAAPAGAQEALVSAEPERFFRPPYVGPRGWLGVYLDVPLDWDEIAGIVEEAYRTVAPPKAAAELDARKRVSP